MSPQATVMAANKGDVSSARNSKLKCHCKLIESETVRTILALSDSA